MDWQAPVAILVVLLAVGWLLRRMWRVTTKALRGDGSVSSCGQCTRNPDADQPTPLVQLKPAKKQS